MASPSSTPNHQATFDRIKASLKVCAQFWLEHASKSDQAYSTIKRRDASELASHPHYGKLSSDIEFYTFTLPEGERIEIDNKDRVRRAVMVYNSCRDSCFAMLELVRKLIKDDPDFRRLEWRRAHQVRPRILLFDSRTLGNETLYKHDFLCIHCHSGAIFVLDVTGWQFGFPSWFYTWSDYRMNYMNHPLQFDTISWIELEIACYHIMMPESEHVRLLDDLRKELAKLDEEGLRKLKEKNEHVEI